MKNVFYPLVRCVPCMAVLLFAANLFAEPSWWSSRNIVISGAGSADYCAANQGQLKNFAMQSWLEMSEIFAYETVSNIHMRVESFGTGGNDFAPVNLGQLKQVAAPFYNVLIAIQAVDTYPWTESTADDDDYCIANLGQLKRVFDFGLEFSGDMDGDGLPDSWELLYGLSRCDTNGVNGADGDPDADRMANCEEYLNETNPVVPN